MAARPRLPASGKIPASSGPIGPTSSPQKRPLPPTAGGPGGVPKPGAAEPSKKKVKKNSGVALGVPGSTAEGDEATANADGAKASNPTPSNLKKDSIGDEASTSATDLGNGKGLDTDVPGAENSDPNSASNLDVNKSNDSTVPLTNGTAGDAS